MEIDDDRLAELLRFLGECLTDPDRAEVNSILGLSDRGAEDLGDPRRFTAARTPGAHDGALAFDAAPGSAAGQRALRIASARLEPLVGRDVIAPAASAAEAYRLALDSLGVNTRGIHHDALPFMLQGRLRERAPQRRDQRSAGIGGFVPSRAGAAIGGTSYLPASVQRTLAGVRSLG